MLPRRFTLEDEEKILRWWYERGIVRRFLEKNKGRPKFWILDGPPYVSGHIHLGTAWNKILKDIYIRYYTMRGYYVHAQAGWDMHGLPIEVLTERKLGFKTKKDILRFGVEKFIEECKKLALKNLAIMTEEFKRLGVFMDWDRPYRTIDREWIEAEWWTFKKAWEAGLITRDVRVVYWCPRCETALAEHEVEYKEIEDPSIYVKFPLLGREREYIVVWTTTPWTLPANLAVLAHPEYTYVKVRVRFRGREEYWWVLQDRLDAVMREAGVEEYEIVERRLGSDLAGWKYKHVLEEEYPRQREFDRQPNVHTIVLGEFVRTTEGSGFVHIAPGHGEEDMIIGKRYNLPIYCPVGPDGTFTEGAWRGLHVREANPHIVRRLEEKGYLIRAGTIRHRYPVCWRCKSPLIFRATEQWFLQVSKIKDAILRANEEVEWIPSWARIRFVDGVRQVGDWCISRQRYWNCPMPVWVCEKCGYHIVVGSFEELKRLAKTPVPDDLDLHRPHIDSVVLKCPKCGGDAKRIPDVLDVWFDSAIASWASLGMPRNEELFRRLWPADLIIEGQDQVLKWFYAQQVLSVICFGRAPYKRVAMHGFVLDAAGCKMSKSLGNIIMPWEVIEKYGADALRMYLVSGIIHEDIRFRWDEVAEVRRALDVLWNVTYMFTLYMNLDKFDPTRVRFEDVRHHLRLEDRWLLSRVNSLVLEVERALEKMQVSVAVRRILEFVTEDLSRFYGKLVRRRLWIERDDPSKLACYYTVYEVYKKLIPVLAVFAPFIAEALYQHVLKPTMPNAPESVHLLDWPRADVSLIDRELERAVDIAREIISAVASIRARQKIKLRWPLRELVIEAKSDEVARAVERLLEVIKEMCNVKHVRLGTVERRLIVRPVMRSLGPKFRDKAVLIAQQLEKINARELKRALDEHGSFTLRVDSHEFKITREDVTFEEVLPKGWDSEETRHAVVYLDTKLTRELLAEGLARDVLRRIQAMRGELDLHVEERIRVYLEAPSELIELIREWLSWIANEARAIEIKLEKPRGYVKTWQIDSYKVTIGIERLSS